MIPEMSTKCEHLHIVVLAAKMDRAEGSLMNLNFGFPFEQWTAILWQSDAALDSRRQVTPNVRCISVVDLLSNSDRNRWIVVGVLARPQICKGVGGTV